MNGIPPSPARPGAPLILLLLLALFALAGGCGKDVCQQGYERQQECVESMNCAAMDPGAQAACEQKKKLFSIGYDIYFGACRDPLSGQPCVCEGTFREQWEQKLSCSMRPESLCECM